MLHLYLISFVQIICHFNILLTEASVIHEAGYVYSIWSTTSHFGYYTSVPFGLLHLIYIPLFMKSSCLMHVDF